MASISFKSLTKIAFGLLAGTALVTVVLPEATLAQTLQKDPNQDFQKEGDSIYGVGTGQSFSVFDLIHRSNLGGNRSVEDVLTEQRENLDAATAEFRARQRQRLQIPSQQIQQLTAPTNSTNTETTPTSQNNQ